MTTQYLRSITAISLHDKKLNRNRILSSSVYLFLRFARHLIIALSQGQIRFRKLNFFYTQFPNQRVQQNA